MGTLFSAQKGQNESLQPHGFERTLQPSENLWYMDIIFKDISLFYWFSKEIICHGTSSLSPLVLLQAYLAIAAGKEMNQKP